MTPLRAAGRLARSFGLALVVAACPSAGRAATLIELSLDDLVSCADVIVVGSVESDSPALLPSGDVETTFSIRVGSPFLGASVGERVKVRQLGGRVGDLRTEVPGSARLAVGEQVVLFLENRPDGDTWILGLSQGVYHVAQADGARVAREDPALAPELSAPRTKAPSEIALDALLADVRERVAKRLSDPDVRCGVRASRR